MLRVRGERITNLPDVATDGASFGIAMAIEPAMRSRAQPNVGQVVPVGKIVAALVARLRPVRDFVVDVTRRGQSLFRQFVHIRGHILICRYHLPLAYPLEERRALFDDEGVEG